ncbi:MAG: hypothetical protein HYU66_02145 [Armatimonadetes bacterium]|nr:hypothetical protein [Armatimonadota bacterium]
MRPEIRASVEVKAELAVRRPPRQLIDLLDTPEDQFRAYIDSIERRPVFQQLVEAGAIQRVKTRGRVPREKYEEYMDVQLMQFLRQYQVTRHTDWERDFLDRDALRHLPRLAEKYGAPAPKLQKMLEYYQRVTSDHYGINGFGHGGSLDDDEPDYPELVPSRADVDMTDSIVLVREFVETYELDEETFRVEFMTGEPSAADLAARHHARLEDVVEVLEVLERLRIVETFVSGTAGMQPAHSGHAQPVEGIRPVANVLLTDHGRCVAIQFSEAGVYAQRYRTSPTALARLGELGDAHAAEELLLELQWINQRKTLLCRLVMSVCNFQYRYLLTGDIHALKPLSQADMARDLGEDEATICRLLRDKFVETPYGVLDVRFFFQRKTDVVRRIVARFPELTDNEVRRILAEDYGTEISRRTVAYHRLKAVRGEP